MEKTMTTTTTTTEYSQNYEPDYSQNYAPQQPATETVQVAATVPGGQQMEVQVGDQQMLVQVPAGVEVGQTFAFMVEVPAKPPPTAMAQPMAMSQPVAAMPVTAQPVAAMPLPTVQGTVVPPAQPNVVVVNSGAPPPPSGGAFGGHGGAIAGAAIGGVLLGPAGMVGGAMIGAGQDRANTGYAMHPSYAMHQSATDSLNAQVAVATGQMSVEQILASCRLCARKPDGTYARCHAHAGLQQVKGVAPGTVCPPVQQTLEHVLASCNLCARKADGTYARCFTHQNITTFVPTNNPQEDKMKIIGGCRLCAYPALCFTHNQMFGPQR